MRTFLLICALALPLLAANSKPAAPSFTADQAQRGRREYVENCAECHGAQSQGRYGPALIGPDDRTQMESVKFVYQFTTAQMPNGNAGGLPQQTYIDIIAYLLEAHGHKPADRPLTVNAANTSTALFGTP